MTNISLNLFPDIFVNYDANIYNQCTIIRYLITNQWLVSDNLIGTFNMI